MKDNETKIKFIEGRARGLSYSRIAEELGTSKQTLINWSKELGTEISNLKAIELDALQEQFYVTRTKRIELLGRKLQALQNEADKRDLRFLPTAKLFDLLLKYSNALKDEEVKTTFISDEVL
jgi:transcriptional regulator